MVNQRCVPGVQDWLQACRARAAPGLAMKTFGPSVKAHGLWEDREMAPHHGVMSVLVKPPKCSDKTGVERGGSGGHS